MEERRTWWEKFTCSEGLNERDRRNQWVAVAWVLTWSLTFALAAFLLRRELVTGPGRWPVAVLPSVIGVGAILVYRQFLSAADELQQKIQLEGLAAGFGAGMIGSLGLELLEDAGGFGFNVSTPMLLMVVAYSVAVVIGNSRYS